MVERHLGRRRRAMDYRRIRQNLPEGEKSNHCRAQYRLRSILESLVRPFLRMVQRHSLEENREQLPADGHIRPRQWLRWDGDRYRVRRPTIRLHLERLRLSRLHAGGFVQESARPNDTHHWSAL